MSEQTQVDLDFEDEKETIVEIPEQVEEQTDSLPTPEGQEDSSGEDEDSFKKSQNATQKRIDKLTKRYRESERQQQEATNFAQQVLAENEQLKNRLNALDTNYVNEYSGRVESEMGQAEQELARAIELGDSAATVAAQKRMTQLALQADRAERAKLQQQAQAAQPQAAQPPPQQQQQAGPQRPDPKAEEWAARNPWFGEDEAKTYAAFGIHKKLIEEQGFDPKSDEYYTELDRQIEETFPSANNEETSTRKRPAQTVAGATRTKKTGRGGKQVRLTPSEVAIAKKLGVPTAEYAKYVKR
jgi:hypothetical protein